MNKEAHESVSPTHDLRKALEGIADDYMTSERHHPGYVLIPTAKFEQLCAAEKLLPPKPQCGAYPECACVAEGICGETETLAHPQQGGERDIMRWAINEMADAAFAVSSTAPSEEQMNRLHTAAEKLLDLRDAALAHPQQGGGRDGSGLDLTALHAANIARQNEWCPDQQPDLSFRGNELAGETGEACNVIKKLERERQGWRGSRATLNDLAEELADVVICADLCAVTAGIDLSAAVVAKFNATSEKVGISVKLPAHPQGH